MQSVRACAVTVLLLLLMAGRSAAQHGSTYLGCFTFPRLLYLKGVEGVKPQQYSKGNIGTCFSKCRVSGYSLSIVATDFRCWCAMSAPPPMAAADEASCAAGSKKGALLFYHHDGEQACRIQDLELEPNNFNTLPQSAKQSVAFDSLAQALTLHLDSSSGQRVVAKFSPQLYGQFDVTAQASVLPGVITSLEVQQAGTAGPQAAFKAPSSEDIAWQVFNNTASGSKNMLLGVVSRARSAVSDLDVLLKPAQYRPLAGLKPEEHLSNTWVTYTINWQPDRATWGLNGVPLATKWASSNLPDAQRSGGVTLYQPPSSTGGRRRLLSSLFELLASLQQKQKGNKLAQQPLTLSGQPKPKQQPQQQQQQQQQQKQKLQAQALQKQQAKLQQAHLQQLPQQQQAQWSPPNKPAQLSFGVRWSAKAGAFVKAAPGSQQQHQLQSSIMEVRRIVCDKDRTRADKGPVVPTWFIFGIGWELKQVQQQRQSQQQQRQQQQLQVQLHHKQQQQQARLQQQRKAEQQSQRLVAELVTEGEQPAVQASKQQRGNTAKAHQATIQSNIASGASGSTAGISHGSGRSSGGSGGSKGSQQAAGAVWEPQGDDGTMSSSSKGSSSSMEAQQQSQKQQQQQQLEQLLEAPRDPWQKALQPQQQEGQQGQGQEQQGQEQQPRNTFNKPLPPQGPVKSKAPVQGSDTVSPGDTAAVLARTPALSLDADSAAALPPEEQPEEWSSGEELQMDDLVQMALQAEEDEEAYLTHPSRLHPVDDDLRWRWAFRD